MNRPLYIYGANNVLTSMCLSSYLNCVSIKIEIPGDYLDIFLVPNGECMWKYGRILQFLVANATILVAMYSVVRNISKRKRRG